MAGKSSKTTPVSVRVPNDTLAVWQSLVGNGSVGAFVLDRALQAEAAEARAAALEVEIKQLREAVNRLGYRPAAAISVPTGLAFAPRPAGSLLKSKKGKQDAS
jgi:hypothetical protein